MPFLLILALAPELDRRYERLYAYLQDHVSRRWPTVDLALHLLCPDAVTRLERRTHFALTAPLIRHGLIRLLAEPDQPNGSLLGHLLKLDEQVVRFVLHQDGLDARLAAFACLSRTSVGLDKLPFDHEIKRTVLAQQSHMTDQGDRLYFQGRRGLGKRQVAAALAAELDTPLLDVNLAEAVAIPGDFADHLGLAFRYAQFYQAVLYLDGIDVLLSQPLLHDHLLRQLANARSINILSGMQPWVTTGNDTLGVIPLRFPAPDFIQRRGWWQMELANHELVLSAPALDTLASRWRLRPAQIAEAVAMACATTPTLDLATLVRAARLQSGHDLALPARKIEPLYT